MSLDELMKYNYQQEKVELDDYMNENIKIKICNYDNIMYVI